MKKIERETHQASKRTFVWLEFVARLQKPSTYVRTHNIGRDSHYISQFETMVIWPHNYTRSISLYTIHDLYPIWIKLVGTLFLTKKSWHQHQPNQMPLFKLIKLNSFDWIRINRVPPIFKIEMAAAEITAKKKLDQISQQCWLMGAHFGSSLIQSLTLFLGFNFNPILTANMSSKFY